MARTLKRSATPPCLTGGENPTGDGLGEGEGYRPEGEYVGNRSVVVDWVSVTFPMSAVQTPEAFVQSVLRLFDGTVTQFRSRPGGLHGYRHSIASDVGGVLIAWGGERTADTLFLQLPGDACARVACWSTLHDFIRQHAGHLTRCDLAFDSLDGEFDLAHAVSLYTSGAFQKRKGHPPKASQAGNWLTPDGTGRTLYVGKRENGKQLCVYEKGKQLGDPSSPWVRWEVRLGNKDRELPLDMLLDPATYFRGSFPCFQFIDAESTRIPTRKAQERITVEKLTRHAREAYGPLVGLLAASGVEAAHIVNRIQRDGLPRRLSAPTADELVDRCNRIAAELANEEIESFVGDWCNPMQAP